METVLGVLAVTAVVVAVTATAERIRFSAPLLLMLAGIVGSYIPGISEPRLTPEVVLFGFLPPLLYAAAIRTSVIDFRANKRSIGYLSVLLVLVTALGVGLVTWLILPVPFAVAFALGAVVAPPDAVAATSIARRVGMPRRLVTILEGESLVNDATAITCLRLAIAGIAGTIGIAEGVAGFLISALGGAAVGLAVAGLAMLIRKHITEPVFDTAISLMVPFAAYLPAEAIRYHEFHGSGVIAVVVAGVMLGHQSAVIQSARSRVSERLNWSTIQFLLENTVFLLIGLQASGIAAAVADSTLSPARITAFCAAVLATVIVLRLGWLILGRAFLFRRRLDMEGAGTFPWSYTLVVGWAGLRGVVTLATALLIPAEVPHRETLILAALVVTAGTLLLQGLTLPGLVRVLGLRGPDARSDALQAATVLQTASNAAIDELDRIREPTDTNEAVELVRSRIAARPDAMWEKLGRNDGDETPAEEYRRLRLATLATEREEVLKIRSSGTVDHAVLEEVLAALDVEESMLTIATQRSDQLDEFQTVATPQTPQGVCDHLAISPKDMEPAGLEVCEDCIREGTRTVHLRICLSCGKVACCDSSPAQHATRHFRNSRHPVVRSFEPGESWRWCFLDERIG